MQAWPQLAGESRFHSEVNSVDIMILSIDAKVLEACDQIILGAQQKCRMM